MDVPQVAHIARAREIFLKELRETANVSASARAAGVARRTVYVWRYADPEFAEAWADAELEAADTLEREAWRRAVEGVDEPVFHLGQKCGQIRRYSDRMLEILLKGHKPEKFVERRILTGANGGPIETHELSAEERAKRVAEILDAGRARRARLAAPGAAGDADDLESKPGAEAGDGQPG